VKLSVTVSVTFKKCTCRQLISTLWTRKKELKIGKTIPLNTKSLGDDISAYPFVEIQWLDIEGDAGWSNTKDLKKKITYLCF